ncbi:MAG TPA: hypothetical protein ENJ37_04995 [Deltaproteobacteria bacterium]|nr:hypothetical protein [Deltaproteobacteria bacterium]
MLREFVGPYLVYPLTERIEGRRIRPKLRVLEREWALPFEQRLALRRRALGRILELAGRTVPYYRDLFRARGFDPSKVEKDPARLEELPYLTKEIIAEQGERLISGNHRREDLHERRTGGSTGASTVVYYSQEALDWTAAANLFVLRWTGRAPHMREARLSSRFPETFPLRDRVREWIKCLALNRVNITTDSFDDDAMARLWEELRAARPYLVQGHPSTFYALARYLEREGIEGGGVLEVFESTGEVLDRRKRQAIESILGCRVFDRYGDAEFGVVAYETGGGRGLKVLDAMVWPETAPVEGGRPGKDAPGEEPGEEIVLTGLTNDAMPLVRYRTGDLGILEERGDGFYLDSIAGRVHDRVRIGAKSYPTHYIQDVLDRLGRIHDFQIELCDGGAPLLRLVVPDEAARPAIEERIRKWWGRAVEIEFCDFAGLRRVGWRGKFRYVVGGGADAASPPCQGEEGIMRQEAAIETDAPEGGAGSGRGRRPLSVSHSSGWYAPENDGVREFRWSSLDATFTIDRLPAPRPPFLMIYAGSPPTGSRRRLTLSGEGGEASLEVKPGWRWYVFPLDGTIGAGRKGRIAVDVPFRAPGDDRTLGLMVSRIEWCDDFHMLFVNDEISSAVRPDVELVEGWHGLEDSGERPFRWCAAEATVRINRPLDGCKPFVVVRAGLPEGSAPRRMSFRGRAGEMSFQCRPGWRYYIFPLRDVMGGDNLVTLTVDGAQVDGADGRTLGVMVSSVELASSYGMLHVNDEASAAGPPEVELLDGWRALEETGPFRFRWCAAEATGRINGRSGGEGGRLVVRCALPRGAASARLVLSGARGSRGAELLDGWRFYSFPLKETVGDDGRFTLTVDGGCVVGDDGARLGVMVSSVELADDGAMEVYDERREFKDAVLYELRTEEGVKGAVTVGGAPGGGKKVYLDVTYVADPRRGGRAAFKAGGFHCSPRVLGGGLRSFSIEVPGAALAEDRALAFESEEPLRVRDIVVRADYYDYMGLRSGEHYDREAREAEARSMERAGRIGLSIQWFVTWKCTLKCPYCWQEIEKGIYRSESLNRIPPQRWAEGFNALRPAMLYFTGGEPSLYKRLPELVNLLDGDISLMMTSNLGPSFDVERFASVVPADRFHELTFSFHPTQQDYDGFFAKLGYLAEKKVKNLQVEMVLYPENLPWAARVLDECRRLGVALRYDPCVSSETERIDLSGLDREEVRDWVRRAVEHTATVKELDPASDRDRYYDFDKSQFWDECAEPDPTAHTVEDEELRCGGAEAEKPPVGRFPIFCPAGMRRINVDGNGNAFVCMSAVGRGKVFGAEALPHYGSIGNIFSEDFRLLERPVICWESFRCSACDFQLLDRAWTAMAPRLKGLPIPE